VIGLALGAGWAEPDATTGYIVPGSPNPRAGHAVSLVAMHRQGGCFEAIMNSWGGEWGRWGYGLLNSEWLTYCQIDTGRQWVVEKDWWQRSAVWDFIIEHRGGAT